MARELGIRRVLCPRASGVLCALGLAAAAPRHDVSRTVLLSGEQLDAERLRELRDALIAVAAAALDGDAQRQRVRYELRYSGQSFELAVEQSQRSSRRAARVLRRRARAALRLPRRRTPPSSSSTCACRSGAPRPSWTYAPASTHAFAPGARIVGPAVLRAARVDAVRPRRLPPSTRRRVELDTGAKGDRGLRHAAGRRMSGLDAIELQVVSGALRAACEEMGVVLIRSAHSSNIKERRDASTALFDTDGEMVMQAEHIPVHLGSMPAAVAAVLERRHAPGVSWILNDPFAGGTHLPDITVITPVFAGAGGGLLGFAACRAHHADVGGRVPGSMPADSRTLAEEGVVISPRVLDDDAIDELVARMRQPQRAPRRPARAARRQPRRRAAPGRARRAPRARAPARGHRRRARLRRAAHARVPAALPDGERSPRTCSRRARATSCCACARPSTASGCCSTSPAAPPSTTATSTARSPSRARPAFRGARAHRPRHPALRRRLPADRRARARGHAAQRAPRRRRRGAATSRPPRASPTSCSPRSAARSGQGTMNNLTLGDERGGERRAEARSPTTRRSAAARARARTPTGRAACTSR